MGIAIKNSEEKFLNSIGFYNEEGFLLNGAVLFADDYCGEKTGMTYENCIEGHDAPVLTFVLVPNDTELDEKVLSFCYYQARKVSEIAEYLGVSDSTYLRKHVLGNLEANGYLEKSKLSRAMLFKTKPDMVNIK